MERDVHKADWALELMKTRQSVRSFKPDPIPDATLRSILEAGINAATGGNLQPYSILVEKDPQRNQRLCELCENQAFIAQAPVNLVFLMDWHKLSTYAQANDAPFTCNKSFRHFLIGLEDLVCCAQTIETAAWLSGIGSCYVGTILESIPECAQLYNLPRFTAPMLLLSLGYPKALSAPRKKLAYEAVVFESIYPDWDADQTHKAYEAKYGDMRTQLPADENRRTAWLQEFRRALLTSYSPEKTENILQAAQESASIAEIQRRFGLHYHAEDMLSPEVIQGLASQGIVPFFGWREIGKE